METIQRRCPGVSPSRFIKNAVAKYLTEDDRYFPLANKHLENLAKETKRIHEEFRLLCDLFFHYLSYFFYLWPEIKYEDRLEMIYHSYVMSHNFTDSLAAKARKGGYVFKFTRQNIEPFMSQYMKDPTFSKIRKKANKTRRRDMERYLRPVTESSSGSTSSR